MIHLRVVAPERFVPETMEILEASPAVCNLIHLPGAARKPDGDLILCDVPHGEASVVVDDLRRLGIEEHGSIAMEKVDTQLSRRATRAERWAEADEIPFADEVLWEDVETRASEDTELSVNFVEFMMIAALIATVGILLDQPILIVGAMVVGPEFGPLAGLCVALVERRLDLVRRSAKALVVGFPAAILVAFLFAELFRATGLAELKPGDVRPFTSFISSPDFFTFFVAYLAGTAGILSLTSSKSGALIGVLVSVTTIPAAANVGVAAAHSEWGDCTGAAAQLGLNLFAIVLGGVVRLAIPRMVYEWRLRKHRRELRLASPESGVRPARRRT
jgi:uncharacterized hydrophobic protein (TIGR00271 family)